MWFAGDVNTLMYAGDFSDIDECERADTCDHHCINTNGSYMCECNAGFKLFQDPKVIVLEQRVIIPNKTCIGKML